MSSNLQDKLSAFQADPPQGAWNRIAAALDAAPSALGERLFQFEQQPPASAWQKIAAALSTGATQEADPQKAVRPFLRPSLLVKFAAAAVVLIVLALGATLVMNQRESSGTTPQPRAGGPVQTAPADTASTPTRLSENAAPAVAVLPEKNTAVRTRKASSVMLAFLPAAPPQERVERKAPLRFNAPADRYMVYSDGKSSPVRLSKKLFDAFSCVQEDLSCRERIQGLQEKMASAALSSDFTGIMELLHHLREN